MAENETEEQTTLEQGLTSWQRDQLDARLDAKHVKTRDKGRAKLSYVEGHYVIREMNRIFGPTGWSRHTLEMRLIHDDVYQGNKGDGRLVGYIGQVEVIIYLPDGPRRNTGWGYGEGIEYKNFAQAHESAVKEAETDAMKRACILFGDPFGLELYGGSNGYSGETTRKRKVEPDAEGTWGKKTADKFREAADAIGMPPEIYQERLAYYNVTELEKLPDKAKKPMRAWLDGQRKNREASETDTGNN